MECTIFYESWQMQCCGTEFKIGDVIEWIVCTSENFTPANINIDYFYEAHSNKWKTLFVCLVQYQRYNYFIKNIFLLLTIKDFLFLPINLL